MVGIATVEKLFDVRPDRLPDRRREIDCDPKLSKIFPNSQPEIQITSVHQTTDWVASLYGRIMMTTMAFHTAINRDDEFNKTEKMFAGHLHIVEHLIGQRELVGKQERIDALELLGATFVDKKRDMLGALKLWKRAMEER